MSLTEVVVKNAKPAEKQFKLYDTDGMFLLVKPNGSKLWRLKYRFGGKEKLLALGGYPEVSLKEARERRNDARKLVAGGTDPIRSRHESEAQRQHTFKFVSQEWLDRKGAPWTEGYRKSVRSRMDRYLIPWLGDRAMAELKAPEILQSLRRIEERGTIETAHRLLHILSAVFRYAVASGIIDGDPTGALAGALTPAQPKHLAAITEPEAFGRLLSAITAYQGSFVVKSLLYLAPLTFVRPGELRRAEWSEINDEAATWSIPAAKMKMREPHLVPLSRQSLQILNDIRPLTGGGKYVFPGPRTPDRPVSENGVTVALRSLGFEKGEMTGHGFRASARTLLDEELHFPAHLIEHQLAHAVKDANGRAYNRTTHLPERRVMMQQWADYLDSLRAQYDEKRKADRL